MTTCSLLRVNASYSKVIPLRSDELVPSSVLVLLPPGALEELAEDDDAAGLGPWNVGCTADRKGAGRKPGPPVFGKAIKRIKPVDHAALPGRSDDRERPPAPDAKLQSHSTVGSQRESVLQDRVGMLKGVGSG